MSLIFAIATTFAACGKSEQAAAPLAAHAPAAAAVSAQAARTQAGGLANSMLRVSCEGDSLGAEVLVNGQFKGECPIDMQVSAGTLKFLARKKVDDTHERIFKEEIRIGDGVVKKIEVILGSAQLTAEASKREKELHAAALKAQGMEFGKVFKDCADCPEMIVIPTGSFQMGGSGSDDSEKPVHTVTIDLAFALGKTEVTQGQWKSVMGNLPPELYSKTCGDDCPVESVSWNDAQNFVKKLNGKTGRNYRLPSEAEWEYACRAGGQQTYCGSNNLDVVGWYDKNSNERLHPVGQKQANAFGLHDMSGGVWEWVQDCWHNNYNGAPSDGSAWTSGKCEYRGQRGGFWNNYARASSAEYRSNCTPDCRQYSTGFRLARTLP